MTGHSVASIVRRAAAGVLCTASLVAAAAASAADVAKAPEVANLLPDSVKSSGVLRIAMPDTGRPLAYKDGDALKGMDPDLARALAATLGLKAELTLIPFASALTGLQANKFDVSFGEFYVTEVRLKAADFVTDWQDFSSFLGVSAKDYKPVNLGEICGHNVGAMAGSAELELLNKGAKDCSGKAPTISAFPSINNAVLALASNRVEAVLVGRGSAADAMKMDKTLTATGEIGGGPCATAVARNENSAKMLDAVKAAYEHLAKTGDYKKILEANETEYGAAKSFESYKEGSTPPKYGF